VYYVKCSNKLSVYQTQCCCDFDLTLPKKLVPEELIERAITLGIQLVEQVQDKNAFVGKTKIKISELVYFAKKNMSRLYNPQCDFILNVLHKDGHIFVPPPTKKIVFNIPKKSIKRNRKTQNEKRQIVALKKKQLVIFKTVAEICFKSISSTVLCLAIQIAQIKRNKNKSKKAIFLGNLVKTVETSMRLLIGAFLFDETMIVLEKKVTCKIIKDKEEVKQEVKKEQDKQEDKQEAKEDKQDKDKEDKECSICLNAMPNVSCVPCGHVCLCEKCDSAIDLGTCPICRENVLMTMKIFY
jgi:hypothetical protein